MTSHSASPRGYVPHQVIRQEDPDGTIRLTSPHALEEVASSTGTWLHRWAQEAPERIFLAERSGEGWREHGYAEVLDLTRALAASLLERGLGPERPVMILSGNGVDHALLSLAAQYVGVPVVPLAEQYSLIPEAHGNVRYIGDLIQPGLVFAAKAGPYDAALGLEVFDGVEKISVDLSGSGQTVTAFSELLKGNAPAEVDAAHRQVGPQTLAKILFTSGSTSHPKGVLTTQKMMCANQAQLQRCLPLLQRRPPKILDWLPWNHVFGSSHNFNMMLANGGSLYIDEGKPTKALFAATLRNQREHAGTLSFNVPVGFGLLVEALKEDQVLREKFFSELELIFYAGASLPQDTWSALESFALEIRGELPMMISSWGMTETAPATLLVHEPIRRSGVVGVPLPEVEAKLMNGEDGRYELRVQGPNIMTGYFKDPEKTAEAFDNEGFLITGDAVRFVDPEKPEAGLIFDGRISEDFKLLTGTWVHANKLRLEALSVFAGLVQDVVITGHDRKEVGILIFPHPEALARFQIKPGSFGEAITEAAYCEEVRKALGKLLEHATGSSTRIARALVAAEPPSLGDGEITSKGSLNIRKILNRREGLIARLYQDSSQDIVRA
ncbi:MAG: feruloyl-CoA synthase [bacterium]